MTSSAVPSARMLPARAQTIGFVLLALVAAAIPTVVPPGMSPYAGLLLVAAGVAFHTLARPSVLLFFIIGASAFAGVFRALETRFTPGLSPTLQRSFWFAAMLIALGVLLLHLHRVRLPKQYYLFLGFFLWGVFRLVTTTPTQAGARHVFYYVIPPAIAAFTLLALSAASPSTHRRLRRTLLYVALLPGLLYLIFVPLALVRLTPGGPYGAMAPRPTALFLALILPLPLGEWRYGTTPADRRRGRLVSVITILTILFTLSRMASLVALVLVGMSRIRPRRPARSFIQIVVTGAVAMGLLLSIPQFRSRFTRPASSPDPVEAINLSNRDVLWPALLVRGLGQPIAGWGPGSARTFSGTLLGRSEGVYPHNEYLHVFHDLGVVGLALMLAAWTAMGWAYATRWRRAERMGDGGNAKWGMVGVLVVFAMLGTATTSNTLHFDFILAPAFLLLEAARSWGSSALSAEA